MVQWVKDLVWLLQWPGLLLRHGFDPQAGESLHAMGMARKKRKRKRRPLYLLTTLRTEIIPVHHPVSSLKHTYWHTVSSQQDSLSGQRMNGHFTGKFMVVIVRGLPGGRLLPSSLKVTSLDQILRPFVIPGYSKPLAAQLSQTFLTAVRVSGA